jgi:hypothetical protein
MSSIVEDWISRANAKQKQGRAGRVKPGLCFCLYTRHRFENIMRPFQVIGCPCYFSLTFSQAPSYTVFFRALALG